MIEEYRASDEHPKSQRMTSTHRGAVLWAEFLYHQLTLVQNEVERYIYETRSREFKTLGRQYGRASQTISFLRGRLSLLEGVLIRARGECHCGAYKKAHDKYSHEDAYELRKQLDRQKELTRYYFTHWVNSEEKN